MLAGFILWSSAAAALAYALLAAWQARSWREGSAARVFLLALMATSLWAFAIAAAGPVTIPTFLAEAVRSLLWLGFMLALLRGGAGDERRPVLLAIFALLALLLAARAALALMLIGQGNADVISAVMQARLALGMAFAIGALILVHHVHSSALPEARWGIRLAMLGLAAMWAYDLNLAAAGYLDARWFAALVAARPLAMALLVPVFALAARRNREWRLGLSRAATFHSLSIAAIGAYLVAMAVATAVLGNVGGDSMRLIEVLFVFGATLAAMLLLPSGRSRAWLKVKVAKHFFQHRYDYREEWLRFTDTLGGPGPGGEAAPLDVRAIKAIADITESPAGLLLRADAQERLAPAAAWRWPEPEGAPAGRALGQHLEASARILELDLLRRPETDLVDEAALVPDWLVADHRAWAIVPLIHGERLEGAVVLARPSLNRMLDWEDFDLLRVAGRQVASHLAEARVQEALSDARRFDEFNRRFAFILHDVKNIASQLAVLTRNAERHADNPAFRADMVATLKGSVGKLNDLLARLSQHNSASRPEEPRPVSLRALAERVAAQRRGGHPVRIGTGDLHALADPARLEQALAHLVQNAVEASPPDRPVWLLLDRHGLEARIAVLDHGHGMSSEFVRAQLFKPFASSKQGGFGIGAFEARTLVAAMGGRLEVESREGEGSRFTIVLPAAAEAIAPRPLPLPVPARAPARRKRA